MVDGFYSGPGHDVLVKASSNKGGHGFAPDRQALHSSLVMAGPSVHRRGSLGVVRMTQIAPTLASMLGVSLAPHAGTPLDLKAPRATALERPDKIEGHPVVWMPFSAHAQVSPVFTSG